MNGNVATQKVNYYKKIKDLVRNEGYIDCQIVGYSSDYDKKIKLDFLNAGACCVELKPSNSFNFKKIIKEFVLKK